MMAQINLFQRILNTQLKTHAAVFRFIKPRIRKWCTKR